jgi:hypothetical protein
MRSVFCVIAFFYFFRLLLKYLPQPLVTHLSCPVFAGGNGHFGKVLFALNHLVDTLLEVSLQIIRCTITLFFCPIQQARSVA